MFIRPSLNTTLGDLQVDLQRRSIDSVRVSPEDISFHLDAVDPTIRLGSLEVAASEASLSRIGDLVQIPQAFLKRATGKVQSQTMNALLDDMVKNTLLKDARVVARHNTLESIDEWGHEPIRQSQIVDVAIKAIDKDAQVARLIDEPHTFGFDVYAPEGFAHGYGGEGVTPYGDGNERNDITAGGLRFGMNIKQGLAPYVQEWMFRLACTNGMEVENAGLKVDARGQSVEEVLAGLEAAAEIAFSRVERDIAAFYEMKEQPVENVERTLRQIAREQGIPNRSTMALMDLAASSDVPDSPSMFDVVNLITNFANNPGVTRDGGRLILERAGGRMVSDHAQRCGHCQQKVR